MTGSPLLVFADDWGRHPSSCQHLIRQLLDRHPVHWVNTIGMRKPAINLATLRRATEKFRQWFRSSPAVEQSQGSAASPDTRAPQVHNPRMWPWLSSRSSRRLNRWLLRRQLLPVVQSLSEPPLAITTIPVVADIMADLPVQAWVYYCVDDFSVWPGLDGTTMQRMEEKLIQQADGFIAVSETLQHRLREAGRPALLLTHGVDLPFWSHPQETPFPELEEAQRPLVVFWGVVDQRLDLAFVRQLAEDLEQGTLVLVGPEAEPDPALASIPRVVRTGSLTFERLPALARHASALIMPYQDLPVTRAMQPLKLKEYLATGRPVIVRDLPANRPWTDCLDLARTPGEFSQMVRQRLQTGCPEEQTRARQRLADESWASKARVFLEYIQGIADGRHSRSERPDFRGAKGGHADCGLRIADWNNKKQHK